MKPARNRTGYWDVTQLPYRRLNRCCGSRGSQRRLPEPPIEPPDGYVDGIYIDDEDGEGENSEDSGIQ